MLYDVLIIAAFRKPTFRTAISPLYRIEEPFDSPPLHIAAGIENAGFTVQYLPLQNLFNGYDEKQDFDNLIKILTSYLAKIVIFSSDNFIPSRSTATLFGIQIISKLLKQINKSVYIGLTGRLATTLKDRLFDRVEELDFLVLGEAELIIGGIVEQIWNSSDKHSITHPNVMFKWHNPIERNSVLPAYIEDVDQIPIPAFHLLKSTIGYLTHTRDRKINNIPFSIRTSLGCKFSCLFCAGVPNWRRYRMKSAIKVAEEADYFIKHLGQIGRISFLEDEIFTFHEDHVKKMTKIFMQRNIKLDGLYTHSTLLTKDIISSLVPITDRVFLGLDSADDFVLKKMGKGQKLETVLNAIEMARSTSLRVHLEWIIGSPYETVDTLIKTLGSIYTLLTTGAVETINTYVYCPHPGTTYAKNCHQHGLAIVGDLEEMQESGGYPTSNNKYLTRNQIYSAYLMSQIIIGEALQYRHYNGVTQKIKRPNYLEMRKLFDLIKSDNKEVVTCISSA